MDSNSPPDDLQDVLLGSFDDITGLLAALAHPNRFKILILLSDKPLRFQTLLREMNVKKSVLANHLTHLRKKALIEKIQHGTYRITEDGKAYIQAIGLAYMESEARKKKIKEAKQREELARSFLERR